MQPWLDHDLSLEIQAGLQAVGAIGRSQPGFALGIKTSWVNRFGLQEEVLLYAQAGWPQAVLPAPEEWACLRLAQLRQVLALADVEPGELSALVNECRCLTTSPPASAYCLLHAAFSPRCTCFSEPVGLLRAFAHGEALEMGVRQPFEPDLLKLAQQVRALPAATSSLLLEYRGLLAGGRSLDECLALAERTGGEAPGQSPSSQRRGPAASAGPGSFTALPELRSRLSALRGRPLVLHHDDSDAMQELAVSPAGKELAGSGLPFPNFFCRTGSPIVIEGAVGDLPDIPAESRAGTTILLHPELGMVSAADTPAAASAAAEVFGTGAAAVAPEGGSAFERWPDPAEIRRSAGWEQPDLPARLPFSGEIALVTGAASGIGKAVVHSLLKRGCAVVGVDVNPIIKTAFDHPSYFGIECDVASEAAVCHTLKTATNRFGGLDMLILNAGLFPSGCNINKLSMDECLRVINVNFTANMVLMREAHQLLSKAPRYGRVVVIGSKNLRAPGPGAAAYSTSKAALTQLARVAALEWGSDGIRVNVIHPDAVFDTALYSEEVLQARAAHYGMTVEQYKKRNLLKTEITSHAVAEMVAEMCGPLFGAMTGGQIQFDGGNDRTL